VGVDDGKTDWTRGAAGQKGEVKLLYSWISELTDEIQRIGASNRSS
jgi:hypothetical protein